MQLLFVADPLCVASMSFYLEMEPSASFLERGGGGYLHTKRLMEEGEGVRREQLKYETNPGRTIHVSAKLLCLSVWSFILLSSITAYNWRKTWKTAQLKYIFACLIELNVDFLLPVQLEVMNNSFSLHCEKHCFTHTSHTNTNCFPTV